MSPDKEFQLILIVDDIPTNLEVLSTTLMNAGFKVAVATDGESAIEQVEYRPPDLILLDVMMPGIDGFETCQKLKENPLTEDVPVIFMTALNETVNKVKGLSLGAIDYVTKPIQSEEVLARIKVHLRLQTLTKMLETQNDLLQEEVEQRKAAETSLQETIEQLKAAQQQIVVQEKLASLGALTAGIAHEIRNPLNIINNYAEGSVELTDEILEELSKHAAKIDPEDFGYIKEVLVDVKENAVAIHKHGQRAENIIDNMMQHSRSERGQRQSIVFNTFFAETVEWACHSKVARNNASQVAIETEYDQDINQIELVPSDLSRALINLLDNAFYAVEAKQQKHLQEASQEVFEPKLSIKTKNLGEAIEIRIFDNGIGIEPELEEKIFNPFFTTKASGEGTGLGLSLTYDIIVKQHRGTLKVDTQPGAYTTFIITLPKKAI
ncbi:MAG: response regulator [Spirulinaceae cyanobacterium]